MTLVVASLAHLPMPASQIHRKNGLGGFYGFGG